MVIFIGLLPKVFGRTDDNERAYATGIAMNNYTITQEGKNPIQVLAGDIFDDDKKVEGMVRGNTQVVLVGDDQQAGSWRDLCGRRSLL